MICKICGKKLFKTHQEDTGESIQQYLSCKDHGQQIIVSTSKRVYGKSGSWIEEIPQDILDKELEK